MADDFTPAGKAEESADRAEIVLIHYSDDVGNTGEDDQTTLADLLADLMHLARINGDLDFDAALATARMHFDAES